MGSPKAWVACGLGWTNSLDIVRIGVPLHHPLVCVSQETAQNEVLQVRSLARITLLFASKKASEISGDLNVVASMFA